MAAHWNDGFYSSPNSLVNDKNIDAYEFRIFITIHSFDYVEKKDLSLSYLSLCTGISRRKVVRCVNKLCELGYIEKIKNIANDGGHNPNSYRIIEPATVKMKKENEDKKGSAHDTPIGSAHDTPIGSAHHAHKEVINKKEIINKKKSTVELGTQRHASEDLDLIFEEWNKLGVITYRQTDIQTKLVKKALKKHPEKCIKAHVEAFKRYAYIIGSPDHFMSYKWNLNEFLSRQSALRYYNPDFNSDDYKENSKKDVGDEIDEMMQRMLRNENSVRCES